MLGTVGAFRLEKAQIDLVRAVHELTARGTDIGALIVGDGSQRPQIECEIQRLGLAGKVHLVGESLDVRPHLPSMDIIRTALSCGRDFLKRSAGSDRHILTSSGIAGGVWKRCCLTAAE